MASLDPQGTAELPLTTPNPYIQGGLADASRQIRLLKLKSGISDDRIDCELFIYDRQAAPAYAAISYTWGEPIESHSITVNGHVISVRENCQYALWQARNFGRYGFLWMDALCINQSSLTEKNHQVAMMGDIFAQAEAVLACVGPHSGDSELALSTLRDVSEPPWFDEPPDDWNEDWERKLKVSDSVRAFSRRAYWQRVWIVQELMVGRVRYILCGSDALDWPRHAEIHHKSLAWPCMLASKPGESLRRKSDLQLQAEVGPMWTIFANVPHRRMSLQDIVHKFHDSECTNPLDRVYGFLSIIKWPDESFSAMNPLQPDYSKSAFELMVECINRLAYRSSDVVCNAAQYSIPDWKAVESLMKCLRLDSSDENIANWILQRQKIWTIGDSSYVERGNGEQRLRFGDYGLAQLFSRLKQTDDESFTAVLRVDANRRGFFYFNEWTTQICRLSTAIERANSAERDAADGIWGLLCPGVQDGDILVDVGFASDRRIAGHYAGLVLREVRDSNVVLEIIGYAAISTSCRLEWAEDICALDEDYMPPQAHNGTFEPRFHGEDIVASIALWDPRRSQSIEEILKTRFTGSRFSSVFEIKPFNKRSERDSPTLALEAVDESSQNAGASSGAACI